MPAGGAPRAKPKRSRRKELTAGVLRNYRKRIMATVDADTMRADLQDCWLSSFSGRSTSTAALDITHPACTETHVLMAIARARGVLIRGVTTASTLNKLPLSTVPAGDRVVYVGKTAFFAKKKGNDRYRLKPVDFKPTADAEPDGK